MYPRRRQARLGSWEENHYGLLLTFCDLQNKYLISVLPYSKTLKAFAPVQKKRPQLIGKVCKAMPDGALTLLPASLIHQYASIARCFPLSILSPSFSTGFSFDSKDYTVLSAVRMILQ